MSRRHQELNYWPAVADVFLVAFLLSLFFWFTHTLLGTLKLDQAAGENGKMSTDNEYLKKQLVEAKKEIESLKEQIAKLKSLLGSREAVIAKLQADLKALDTSAHELILAQAEVMKLKVRIAQLEAINENLYQPSNYIKTVLTENEQLKAEVAQLKQQLTGIVHDKPPNIDLTDRANFKFESGSAAFTPAFLDAFNASPDLERLPEIVRDYKVNVIEVIGHTDADWNLAHGAVSNLDEHLGSALTAAPGDIAPLKRIEFGSNADLGLMRAIAVRQLIRKRLQAANLSGIQVRCYSAAQSVIPSGESQSAKDYLKPEFPEADRRRIEIRFTRLPK